VISPEQGQGIPLESAWIIGDFEHIFPHRVKGLDSDFPGKSALQGNPGRQKRLRKEPLSEQHLSCGEEDLNLHELSPTSTV
jgi:hypothetical protein